MLGVQYPTIGVTGFVKLCVYATPDLRKTYSRACHNTRVSLLLSRVPENLMALRRCPVIRHLLREGPCLLKQPNVGIYEVNESI